MFNALSFVLNAAVRSGNTRQGSFFSNDDVNFESFTAPQAMLLSQPDTDAATQPLWAKAQQQIAALKQIDSGFNEIAFSETAATAYTKTLSAENAMDANVARGVVTPAYAANLAARIDAWENQGFRRVVSGLKLDGTTIFKVALDGVSESIVVRISGSGVRYTQDTASGTASEGSVQNETFTEFATFVRPAGSVTPKTAQAGGPTHCPSCGAPAPANATICPYCNTPLTASAAPWLLDHVSQSAYV
ncbi:MAG TPA: TIM44-like domain-containing protein [Candidatus Eremiobacteraceae bacterium]|nr:TIM44-like domain-containing protein [Candidatus Eremiobacteraceae bacterium]